MTTLVMTLDLGGYCIYDIAINLSMYTLSPIDDYVTTYTSFINTVKCHTP
jgi:hypothetical protein